VVVVVVVVAVVVVVVVVAFLILVKKIIIIVVAHVLICVCSYLCPRVFIYGQIRVHTFRGLKDLTHTPVCACFCVGVRSERAEEQAGASK
jgi:hypothetical protein